MNEEAFLNSFDHSSSRHVRIDLDLHGDGHMWLPSRVLNEMIKISRITSGTGSGYRPVSFVTKLGSGFTKTFNDESTLLDLVCSVEDR